MPKKKKPRKKKRVTVKRDSDSTSTKRSKDNAAESKRSLIKRILFIAWNAIAVVSVLITIWVAATPRVFVYPRASLDPNNPVYTFFAVRNEGFLAVRDVKVSCSAKYLKLAGDIHVIGLGDYTNRFSDPKQVARVIAREEEYSVLLPLSGLKHNQIENADIAIVLSFRPYRWLPWRRERLHRFVSTQGKDGQWHWLPQPINK